MVTRLCCVVLGCLMGAVFVACGPTRSPVKVEAIVVDKGANPTYRIDVVELRSAEDVLRGKGAYFDVRGDINLPLGGVLERLSDDNLTYAQMIEAARGSGGVELDMNLHWDGEVWRAVDFDGLQYLTLFHHFESVWNFFRPLQPDGEWGDTPHPLIAYHGSIALTEQVPIPILNSDNAAYVAPADTWLALRSVLNDEGIPFIMNPGIVAHEFHHRLFFHALFSGSRFETWRAWMSEDGELSTASKLLKGLDEGLADIAAIAFQEDGAFMGASLTGLFASQASFRDIDGEFARGVTFDDLASGAGSGAAARHCGLSEPNFGASDFNYYCLGTVLARGIYEAAGEDFATLREVLLPALYLSLPLLGAEIDQRSRAQGVLVFELEMFLDRFAASVKELEAERGQGTIVWEQLCGAYTRRFASLNVPGKVPSCFP